MQRTTPTERRYGSLGRGTALLALTACLFVPSIAQAQDNNAGGTGEKSGSPASSLADKKVTVDADNTKLTEVLPPLMKSVGADFVLDNSLKNATVTMHLTNVRFQAALDTLLKVCSEPVTYKLEDGVYHFVPGVHAPDPAPTVPSPGRPQGPSYKIGKIIVQNASAQELVDFLTGDPGVLDNAPSSLSINPDIGGFRSYSSGGLFGGNSSYNAPITNDGNYGFGNGSYRSNRSSGGGISFGPFGWSPGGGFRAGGTFSSGSSFSFGGRRP